MIDREKVVERLGKVSYYFKSMLVVGWQGDADIYREHRESVNMAIALLKKQEALPIVYQTNEYTGLPMSRCPSCGEYLVQFHSGVDGKESRFCYYCGQEVKWE